MVKLREQSRSARESALFERTRMPPIILTLCAMSIIFRSFLARPSPKPRRMTITEYIKADLKTRIAAGEPLPNKLTLTALSEHYAVSHTPVRQAVRDLIAEKYLEKRPNGRLAQVSGKRVSGRREAVPNGTGKSKKNTRKAGPSSPTSPAIATFPETNRGQAATDEAITADVIRRSLLGETGFLREEAACEEFDVGRSVIRRVFSTLAGRGLIEHVPRRGWRIRAYQEADMLQYLDVRESLELKALDLAWDKLELARIELFLSGNSREAAKRQQIDNRLHQYWIEQCGNRYIVDFFARHGGYFSALFDQAAMTDIVIREAAAEHRSILKAISNRDRRKAKKRLAQHIRGQRPKVSQMYESLKATGEPGN